jgi:hypothetical protein
MTYRVDRQFWRTGAYLDPRWNRVEEVELGVRVMVRRHDENWVGHHMRNAQALVRLWEFPSAR